MGRRRFLKLLSSNTRYCTHTIIRHLLTPASARAHTHRHAGIERLFISLSLCLSVSLSAVSFYDNQPTIRLAVQLPCDLFASTLQCLIPLVLTTGTSCFGAYEWESGESAFQSYVYNVATLRRYSYLSYPPQVACVRRWGCKLQCWLLTRAFTSYFCSLDAAARMSAAMTPTRRKRVAGV